MLPFEKRNVLERTVALNIVLSVSKYLRCRQLPTGILSSHVKLQLKNNQKERVVIFQLQT